MSRTTKGTKHFFYDPDYGDIKTKQVLHQQERARAKQELLKEPLEPEYDPSEYIPKCCMCCKINIGDVSCCIDTE